MEEARMQGTLPMKEWSVAKATLDEVFLRIVTEAEFLQKHAHLDSAHAQPAGTKQGSRLRKLTDDAGEQCSECPTE